MCMAGAAGDTSWAEVVLVGVLELGLVQQLVEADNLLVVQLSRHCILVHTTPHLRYQASCISPALTCQKQQQEAGDMSDLGVLMCCINGLLTCVVLGD